MSKNQITAEEILTAAQINGVREAAVTHGINVNSFEWFIEGFQSKNDNGTNATVTLGELLELQAYRDEEGQTPLNGSAIKKMFVIGSGNTPLLAGSYSKAGKLTRTEYNQLYEPIVIGEVETTGLRGIVSGGHRTKTLQILIEILLADDLDAARLYIDETVVKVVIRKYADRDEFAKAMLAANGSRTADMVEKKAVALIAKFGVNVANVDELKEAILANKVKVKDWAFKVATENRTLVNRHDNNSPLKELTQKDLFGAVYDALLEEPFDLKLADENGVETDKVVGEYRFIKDLMLSNRHKYSLTEDTMKIWADYDATGEKWVFNDSKKHWEWVIPSHLFEILAIAGEQAELFLKTDETTDIARNARELGRKIAVWVIDAILAKESLAQYALPPKPPTASKKASVARRTTK